MAIRPVVCEKKRFAQKFTDGRTDRQTDRRTDDGRLAIALTYSWNELKIANENKMLMRAAIVVQVLQDFLSFIAAACYVAAKATYIRLLHGKIGILEGFFGPNSVHRGRTHIVLG